MWNWISVGGGDGFQTQIDPTDPNIFYTESQNGDINRYDLNTGTNTQHQAGRTRRRVAAADAARGGGGGAAGGAAWRCVREAAGGGAGGGGGQGGGRGQRHQPRAARLAQPFNWNSPIRLSPHNPSTVLFGGTAALRLARSRRHAGR